VAQIVSALEALAHSGAWVSIAAAGLAIASSLALGLAPDPRVATTVFCGTFAVYGLDRLRDVDRDQHSSPRRTRFVLRNENRIALAAIAAGAAALGFGVGLGARAISLLALCAAAGLLHRRLKRYRSAKPVYIAATWTAVVVGFPASVDSAPRGVGGVALAIGLSILANAIASNVRDGEQRIPDAARALQLARLCAGLSLAFSLSGLAGPRAIAAIPAATLAALLRERIDERWGLVAVDGALVAGAALAIAFQ
jgi:4-hydroxybenzoate polyprenyltransferase